MKRVVTIHQPDFMPWLGLFDKINNADEFILLDHVTNNPKSADFYGRRVKFLIGGNEHWMSVTLKKDPNNTFVPISEMELNMSPKDIQKFTRSIEQSYKKTPHFNDVFPLIQDYFALEIGLSERNFKFITTVMNKLEIKTSVIKSSEMNPSFSSNEMLIDLLKKTSATHYLCGSGSDGYQNDELFKRNGLKVVYNNFQHPNYTQHNSKVPILGLSITDVLMNIGYSETQSLLHK